MNRAFYDLEPPPRQPKRHLRVFKEPQMRDVPTPRVCLNIMRSHGVTDIASSMIITAQDARDLAAALIEIADEIQGES